MTKEHFFQILDIILANCDEITIADEVKINQAIKKIFDKTEKSD